MRRYSAYKDSGIEWVGEIPVQWLIKPLFALFKERQVPNENNQVANVLSLSYGRIIRRDVGLNFGLLPESFEAYNIVEPFNIVLRLTDLQNDKRSLRCGFVKEKGIITSAYLTLEKTSDVDCKYMYYLLHSYDIRKVFYSMGGGVRQAIKFDDLKWLSILLPTLQEQQAIAFFLDRKIAQIDDLIVKKEWMIELLKEERKAAINQAVTKGLSSKAEMKKTGVEQLSLVPNHWQIIKLGKVGVFSASGIDKKSDINELPVSMVNYTNVYGNAMLEIQSSNSLMETTTTAEKIGEHSLKKGDILFTPSSETAEDIGVSAVVTRDLANTVYSYHLIRLRISERFNFDLGFKKYFCNAHEILSQFSKACKGTTRQILGRDDFKSIFVLIPPIEEQKTIAFYLDHKITQIYAQINREKKSIDYLKEYRTSLISEVVTGKIDVRRDVA